MTYTILEDDGTLVVRMQGRLDRQGTPDVETALEGKLDDVTDLTLDLRGVNYVSSWGLRFLLALQKRMYKQGSMQIINVCDEVMELLDETGFSQIMTVVPAE